MKRLTITLFALFLFSSTFSQHTGINPVLSVSSDSLNKLKTLSFYNDTLWVMDSVYNYGKYYVGINLLETYIITSRDENGNQLTGVGRHLYNYAFENKTLDSIFYFAETSDVQYEKSYTWNKIDKIWMKSELTEYDPNGRILQTSQKYWSNEKLQYTGGRKFLFMYHDTLVSEWVYQTFIPETGLWVNEGKTAYTRSQSNQDSLITQFIWNADLQNWTNKLMSQFYYDEPSRIKYVNRSKWNDTSYQWINETQTRYVYMTDNIIDSVIINDWSSVSNDWIHDRIITHKYDEFNQLIERTTKVYVDSIASWGNSLKNEFYYENLNTTQLYFVGDSITEAWYPATRRFQSINAAGQVDTMQYESWDEEYDSWIYTHSNIKVYDQRFNLVEEIFNLWDVVLDSWEKWSQRIYYWSPFRPLHTEENKSVSLSIYPNPANNFLKIQIGHQEHSTTQNAKGILLDMQGNILDQIEMSRLEITYIMSVREYPTGIYLFIFDNGKSQVTSKKKI